MTYYLSCVRCFVLVFIIIFVVIIITNVIIVNIVIVVISMLELYTCMFFVVQVMS